MLAAIALVSAATLTAAEVEAQNSFPNPYQTVEGVWAELPDGRSWGATSAVAASPDGETIWAIDRCGANACPPEYNQDIIFQFDKDGNILESFGAGLIVWPHGIDVDSQGNVWVADARGDEGRGHQIASVDHRGRRGKAVGDPPVGESSESRAPPRQDQQEHDDRQELGEREVIASKKEQAGSGDRAPVERPRVVDHQRVKEAFAGVGDQSEQRGQRDQRSREPIDVRPGSICSGQHRTVSRA